MQIVGIVPIKLKRSRYAKIILISFIICAITSLTFLISIFDLESMFVVSGSSFTPASPEGPAAGFIGIEYEFIIYTTNPDSEWMFDWGDGTYSDWISLEDTASSIKLSHSWLSAGNYQVRVNYKNDYFTDGVWSETTDILISTINTNDYPETPVIPNGNSKGCENVEYVFSTSSTDLKDDYIQYRFDWGDGTYSDWTSLVPSGITASKINSWDSSGIYQVKAQTRDRYLLESSWSDFMEIEIQKDTDGDKLSDLDENRFNSNIDNPDDVVFFSNKYFYIIFATDSAVIFYNENTGDSSLINTNKAGNYLIDSDSDEYYEYIYYPETGSLENYVKTQASSKPFISLPFDISLNWIFILVAIIVGIIITIFILIKFEILYVYEEEVLVEE